MTTSIVFTGGGSAGHVTPNLALIELLKKENWQINYIGSYNGVEKKIIAGIDIPYYAINSGKLRRYFSWQHIFEPIKIASGIFQAYFLLGKLKTQLVFSKGGFVAFPVVIAAWLRRIPIIAHESDLSPGLANRLSFPFVNKICLTFEVGKKHFKKSTKIEVTGTPLRSQLFKGSKEKGLALCSFTAAKPCLLVIGGSLGSHHLNTTLRATLNLLEAYQIIHICGPGKIDSTLVNKAGYYQREYVNEELPDLFAASDIIISRAGANTLYEILALNKAHILVPLSAQVSRGDQIQNAAYFKQLGISTVIEEERLSPEHLVKVITTVYQDQKAIVTKIKDLNIEPANHKIIALIKEGINAK